VLGSLVAGNPAHADKDRKSFDVLENLCRFSKQIPLLDAAFCFEGTQGHTLDDGLL
jgi:hypothetical protein